MRTSLSAKKQLAVATSVDTYGQGVGRLSQAQSQATLPAIGRTPATRNPYGDLGVRRGQHASQRSAADLRNAEAARDYKAAVTGEVDEFLPTAYSANSLERLRNQRRTTHNAKKRTLKARKDQNESDVYHLDK